MCLFRKGVLAVINLPRVLGAGMKETRRLHPLSLAINESLVPLSTATMVVMDNEAVEGRTYIRLFTPNGGSGIYRTRVPETHHVEETAVIQMEHAVCEIGDYMVRAAIEEETTVRAAFVTLFSHYRGTLWQLGSFTANESVTLDVDYENLLEKLLAVLNQVPKYYLTFNFSTTPWTLGLAEKTQTVTAEGRLSRNVADDVVRRDDKELCTRVFVRGLPKPAGQEDDEDAVGYMDADTIGLYGVVERETGGPSLSQAQAQRVAEAYLAAHKHPKLSVEIEAADLSEITGEAMDRFTLGKRFRLAVPEKGEVITDYITKIAWRDVYNAPYQASIVIGDYQDAALTFLQDQASAAKGASRGAKRDAKNFVKVFSLTDEAGNILQQAGMQLDANGLLVYAQDNENNLMSIVTQTASSIKSIVESKEAGLESRIEQTAGEIMLEVADTKSGLHSLIEQTPEMIRSEVGSAVSGFAQSVIEQTASYIRMEVTNAASSISQSVIEQTTDYIRTEVTSVASGIAWSVIEQTMTGIIQTVGTKARVYVGVIRPTGDIHEGDIWINSPLLDSWGGLADGTWQSSADFRWKDYAGAEMYVWKDGDWHLIGDSAEVAEMDVVIEHDREHWAAVATKVDTLGNDWNSRLEVTAEYIRGDVSTAKSTLYSVVMQTATNVFSGVYDKVGDNFSTIEQTAEKVRVDVASAKSSLYAVIQVTSTQIFTGVFNKADEKYSTITQTANDIKLAVAAGKSAVYESVILQTATDIHIAVRDSKSELSSSIKVQADRISLVVSGTGANAKIRPAQIVAAINDGASSVVISADHINLDGYVKATDIDAAFIKTKVEAADRINVRALYIPNGETGTHSTNWENVKNSIYDVKIEQNGNIYKLQKRTWLSDWVDAGVSFSRATSLSGTWSGGTFTVNATPQGNTLSAQLFDLTSSDVTWQGRTGTIKVYANLNGGETKYDTGKRLSVTAPVTPTTLSGSWSGRTFTVTADPQGDIKIGRVYDGVVVLGNPPEYRKSGSDHYIKQWIRIYSEDLETGDAHTTIMDKAVEFKANLAYEAGRTVTSWDASWNAGKLSIKPQPQNVEFWATVYGGSMSRSGRNVTIPIKSVNKNTDPSETTVGNATGTISLYKTEITLLRNKVSSEPSTYDGVFSAITSNGWYTITCRVLGQEVVYKVQVDV